MVKKIVVDDNLECPYLFDMDRERYKFKGCKTWEEAEWAKKGWDEGVTKATRVERERIINIIQDNYIPGRDMQLLLKDIRK